MKNKAILPFHFNDKLLREELYSCMGSWTKHFNTTYYEGDWSGIVLRGPSKTNHALSTGQGEYEEYKDSPLLNDLPYTRQVLEDLPFLKTSVRYLRLSPGSEIKPHKDHDLVFWDGQVRLHVPVLTNEHVEFIIAGEQVHMRAGECWFADFSQTHSVKNKGQTDRIHLVVDCIVDKRLKELFEEKEIIQKGEEAPDPISGYEKDDLLKVIDNLEQLGSETSLNHARELRKKLKNS